MASDSPHSEETLRIIRCHTFLSRLKGFQGRREIAAGEVLWLKPCSAVHTFGMVCTLTLLFLDKQHNLVRVVPTAPPNRLFFCGSANSVIEMAVRAELEIATIWPYVSSKIGRT